MAVQLMALWLAFFALFQLRPDFDSLVEAERSFARASVAKGIKDAFLTNLAEDSVIFRPRAVDGKQWFTQSPASPAILNWEPEFADIAASGELGYTTGPWEIRRTAQEEPVAFGHYLTVWRKDSNGIWKVALDNGIGHDRTAKPARVDSPPLPAKISPALPESARTAALQAISAADKLPAATLMQRAAEGIRLYRDGSPPAVGRNAAESYLRGVRGTAVTVQGGASISNSGDFAYTYGSVEFQPADKSKTAETSNYTRIWKKRQDGSWSVVVDLWSPVPKG